MQPSLCRDVLRLESSRTLSFRRHWPENSNGLSHLYRIVAQPRPRGKGNRLDAHAPIVAGVVVASATTLLISVAGRHLWSIVAFALHQLRATSEPHDGLYHQIQALLANASYSSSTARMLLSMGWKWRSSARDAPWRLQNLLVLIVASFHLVGIAFLGISISYWLNLDSPVLGTGENCGVMTESKLHRDGLPFIDISNIVFTWGNRIAAGSLDYAQRCYAKTRAENGACASFHRKTLPFTNRTVPCPFSDTICAVPHAFQVDSGFIHSDTHLGVNLPLESRVSFRKVITCSPTLAEDNFSTEWIRDDPTQASSPFSMQGDSYKYYMLGPTAYDN